jgi:omega-6 fatty acid desaturase / acyl-lipid omega-6 desaturase (Delta-12 desaturase)
MTPTTIPKRTALQRNLKAELSVAVSPRQSPSTMLLSSPASDAEMHGRKMLDTYENDFGVPDFTIKEIHDAIPSHCLKLLTLRSQAPGLYGKASCLFGDPFHIFHNYVTPATAPSMLAGMLLCAPLAFV